MQACAPIQMPATLATTHCLLFGRPRVKCRKKAGKAVERAQGGDGVSCMACYLLMMRIHAGGVRGMARITGVKLLEGRRWQFRRCGKRARTAGLGIAAASC